MRSFDSIFFDATGFTFQGDTDGPRVWHTEAGDGLGLFHFEKPPNIEADLNALNDVRRFYRKSILSAGLGLIEVETPEIDGCLAARTIAKTPQKPHGMTYIGSITLPFRDFSYVVKIQCAEQGIIGLRDAAILDLLLGAGQITFSGAAGGKISGWAQAPYDPAINAPLLRNLSEDEKYDAQFPDHPLSRVRAALRQVQFSLRLAPEVKHAPPFVYSAPQTAKAWWKKW